MQKQYGQFQLLQMTKKIIIASLLIIFIGLAVFFKYFVNESIFKSLMSSFFITFFLIMCGSLILFVSEYLKGFVKNKFIILLFIIFIVSLILLIFFDSNEPFNVAGGLTLGLGILIGLVLTIYKFYKEGFNSELVRWVFWIVFLGSCYGLFDYVKEEHGFKASLTLFIVIMIAIALLYFFVIDPIAKKIDESRAYKSKINELEKRIDNIEKDK